MAARGRPREIMHFETIERRLMLATTPVVVDLLAVYTPVAASQNGGDTQITSLIQASVDLMNRALVNSEISLTVRLVHAESISYSGSDNLPTDRARLENLPTVTWIRSTDCETPGARTWLR